jgi:hypothetical protein
MARRGGIAIACPPPHPEIVRRGMAEGDMAEGDMAELAGLMARVLVEGEAPETMAPDASAFRRRFSAPCGVIEGRSFSPPFFP